MSGSANYITPAGLAALRARYDRLLGTERPEIVAVVSWAAGNGGNDWLERVPGAAKAVLPASNNAAAAAIL